LVDRAEAAAPEIVRYNPAPCYKKPREATPRWAGILERCHEAAISLLKANATEHGILAATPTERARRKNYHTGFARDAGLCTLAMVRSGNAHSSNVPAIVYVHSR
jgi:hypothetical protein